ncbi:histidine phosphatase superfamily [Phakopsora pachyrhizi]|uniref:Histidine phosphatase superfamily n=1 Tax=Phakopsora pachyrhizi TaxID=170000 RepID=A0AAV0BKV0_PHAPC|nr:histidine phosphatase superfamily [Phakopsora pachyrhizi]KAI8453849.1 histidine phosphatase superfamily [Phakopsora pachyrhizi]CAH7687241.1 histidine phosphatase superfamily [Phakopsora pachyrhizi]
MSEAEDDRGRGRRITLTLIRHGESVDNLSHRWAGVKDSDLSNHGFNQAQSLSEYFKKKSIRFTKIYCSDLQRARLTAQSVSNNQLQQSSKTKPKDSQKNDDEDDEESFLQVLPILREQNFGIAEGKPWNSGEFEFSTKFFTERDIGFKDGESLNQVFGRAKRFFEDVIISKYLSNYSSDTQELKGSDLDKKSEEEDEVNICIVSHGIFLAEFINVLKSMADRLEGPKIMSEMSNTGWTKIQLDSFYPSSTSSPSISMRVLITNHTDHLTDLTRQPGGIGSSKYDPKQSKLDSFF